MGRAQGPDLLITDQQFVVNLITAGLVSDLTNLVEPAFLQRYVPGAQETMSYKGKLYGLPVTMESMAMYYNKKLVTDPARDLTDLLNQAAPERQVVLPIDFYFAYWGIPAFGGRLFDSGGQVILNEGGFAEWLSWLQVAQDQPGIQWTTTREKALELFIKNKAAYLAGEKWMENALQEQLGADKLGVAPLPAGPKGEAGPFLVVTGVLLNPASDPEESALALEFARYIAGLESQTLLMKQANLVPANVNVDTTDHPIINGFLEQARTAVVTPNDRVEQVLLMWYSDYDIYHEVLVGGQNPAEAVNHFTILVNKAYHAAEPSAPNQK
jgi:arabinogalactan oligomer/maltooligosaccharide transport system substrate-binding protein